MKRPDVRRALTHELIEDAPDVRDHRGCRGLETEQRKPALDESEILRKPPRPFIAPLAGLGRDVQIERGSEEPPDGLIGIGQVGIRAIGSVGGKLGLGGLGLGKQKMAERVPRGSLQLVGDRRCAEIGFGTVNQRLGGSGIGSQVEQPAQVAQCAAKLERTSVVRTLLERTSRVRQPDVDPLRELSRVGRTEEARLAIGEPPALDDRLEPRRIERLDCGELRIRDGKHAGGRLGVASR